MGERGKNLSVARMRNARCAQGLLVERRCGDRRHLTAERSVNGILHVCISRATGVGIHRARFKITRGDRTQVQHTRLICFRQTSDVFRRLRQSALLRRLLQHHSIAKHHRHTQLRHLGIVQQMQTNLRPNPCGIAHRHSYFRKAHECAGKLNTDRQGAQRKLILTKSSKARRKTPRPRVW